VTRPFEKKGRVTVREACETITRRLAPDEGIGYAEALEDVRALTERDDVELRIVQQTMNDLTDALHAAGEPGMRTVRHYGWVRETARDMLLYADEREQRGRRQVLRMGVTAKAIDPEQLDGSDRLRRDVKMRTAAQLEQLMGQRARRLRPPPALGA
jgi:hypothetical protein